MNFITTSPDVVTQTLMGKIAEGLEPPVSHKKVEFWQELLADHVRNQHRLAVGAQLHTARWSHEPVLRCRCGEVIAQVPVYGGVEDVYALCPVHGAPEEEGPDDWAGGNDGAIDTYDFDDAA